MFDLVAVLFFWFPVGIIFYHWVLYPLILRTLIGLRSPEKPAAVGEVPFVSLVMAAHNEERLIADKLRNCLDLDFPAERMEIIVGSDASTDATDSIVASFTDPRIRWFRYEPQSGKVATQNRLLGEVKGDAVLLTDVDTQMTKESLGLMVQRLYDPAVAVVAPNYRRVNVEGSAAEGFYDRWEAKVKELEGRLGAMVGAYGWALLLRREFSQPIPDDTILDDFVFGVRPFRQDRDAVTEPRALVTTRTEAEGLEFRRKVRISRGNLQVLLRYADLLSPKHGLRAWVYFSHKVLRMLVPFLLIAILAASAVNARHAFFLVLLIPQLVVLASVPLLVTAGGKWRRLLLPQYYYFMNIAILVGYWRFFTGRREYWTKTPRA